MTGYRCRRPRSRAADVWLVKLLVHTSNVRLASAGGGHSRWVNALVDTQFLTTMSVPIRLSN